MKIEKIKGLIAAPPTGFTEEGAVDLSVVSPLAEHLEKQGVRGVFINGTTGEGASLSSKERIQLAEQWRRVLPREMLLIVHVGHSSAEESRELALHAGRIGADAVASIAPGFYKPSNMDDLINWCDPIASAVPELPFYFYHMPSMNGVNMNIAKLIPKIKAHIPNFAGVKYTFETMGDYFESVQSNPELNILWGRDEMLLGALAMGAKGAVGSIYNIASPLFLKMIENYDNLEIDAAQVLQFQIIKLINIIVKNGNFFSSLKKVLALQGVPISYTTRAPLGTLTEDQSKELVDSLQDWKNEWSTLLF
ncbi:MULTISPECIES: dihydrodipicolinate synthase family protein [unclassified Oceanispirochaeta]|uniref:dihydrodipicolinate synthase family protein n=1 Tax=unclassified Oceanispirochaeta TaxID=2635722 RepID=UPI000E090EB5|nr:MULTISPECIES: dihydrodipicolinate synthase family protein [unclassified Oceanispirochaeta]MBF9017628.1 dihydrodipicolinate synthase family protein [Oceanispirochaeta sp. M2]NPD74200.1 dihydrodipicolinate synthetase [Oceanispirochaeta sp. M1]RDG30012.1 dihydrodipicolinate synthetase [Oceanispirochaeta sp. M1]